MLLIKMGWTEYKWGYSNSPFFDDPNLVKFYIRKETKYIIIKEIERKKQILKNSYKFVVGDKEIYFNSNMELLKLVINHEACNEEYKRHFKLNRILK